MDESKKCLKYKTKQENVVRLEVGCETKNPRKKNALKRLKTLCNNGKLSCHQLVPPIS